MAEGFFLHMIVNDKSYLSDKSSLLIMTKWQGTYPNPKCHFNLKIVFYQTLPHIERERSHRNPYLIIQGQVIFVQLLKRIWNKLLKLGWGVVEK